MIGQLVSKLLQNPTDNSLVLTSSFYLLSYITLNSALILMALLLLRHALSVTDGDSSDDDPSNFFSLFLLPAAGYLLPCYIMAWAISILQRRRQRQEAAALAATQVAFVLNSGQRRGLHFAIAPAPASAPGPTVQQEQV
ncbi:hypothetical protein P8452_47537 [Trifolium repens]|nr:hypothetical protein P8452_47537 [Trifolium repens]